MTRLTQRYTWAELASAQQREVLQRPAVAAGADTVAGVRKILADVRSGGDATLRELTEKLDGVLIDGPSHARFQDALTVRPPGWRAGQQRELGTLGDGDVFAVDRAK